MKYLSILLIGLLSVGCMTVNRVKRNCDLFADICVTKVETETDTTTTTTTETEYGDTTATVHIPEEIIKDEKPVIIVDEKKKPVPIKKEYVNSELSVLSVPFAMSTAQVINSKLKHELTQTDTILLFRLKNALKTVKILEKQNTVLKEKYVVTLYENKPFAKFTIKWFVGSVILIFILLTIWFFKYKSRILGIIK